MYTLQEERESVNLNVISLQVQLSAIHHSSKQCDIDYALLQRN